MDELLLARLQFAVTTVYHFFFVPLTLGLGPLVAIMQTMYVRTGRQEYRRMTKFWGKLFVINFAMGVVTGIVMEFQFGMNWSEYSRFVGDIFGAPLAIEALLAFFLESTFLGIWIFGWDRLNRTVHLFAIWMVVIGSWVSALWILIANSFMQEPVAYTLNEGRAEMTNFGDLLTNPHVWVQFPHVLTAAVTTGAFFVLGISAYRLLKSRGDREQPLRDLFMRSFRWAAVYGAIGVFLVIMVGHQQAQHMVQVQPMKMAAAEGLFESEDPASMSLLTIGDEPGRRDVFSIRIPGLLSFLAYNRFEGRIEGINDLNAAYQAQFADQYGPDADYVPPLALNYWSFRAMVGAGFLMLALALYALYLLYKRRLMTRRRFLRLMVWAIALPYIANSTGWLLTELGRQPWIVFGLQRIEEAVSPNVTTGMLLASLVLFTVIYGILIAVDVYLLRKYAMADPHAKEDDAALTLESAF
ncbi:MAG: cytochrome ubiquinol oxidase subunit I [Anaerolineae bacterium]